MESGFESRILICSECGQEFVFTGQAQQYFAERGYTDDPKRCKSCHTKFKKSQRDHRHQPESVPSEYPSAQE
ncbi:MAG TPA: zinc-ribbon domain containing protein [Candidatus Deferrimicrobium sp.]|nr:zinc-ribbon domain containing protein [Candidatus Deferrimicrobium sp.]